MERDVFDALPEGGEYSSPDPGGEFTPPLPEFPPYSDAAPEGERKRRKRKFFLAGAAVLMALLVFGKAFPPPHPTAQAPSPDVTEPVPTQTQPEPAPTTVETGPVEEIPSFEALYVAFSSRVEGKLLLSHGERIESLSVEAWDRATETSLGVWDVPGEALQAGSFTLPEMDLYDLYLSGGQEIWPTPELHVSMVYRERGEEKQVTAVQPLVNGEGWYLKYDPADAVKTDYTFPGCFVLVPYDSGITKELLVIGEEPQPDKITVMGEIAGRPLTTLDYTIETLRNEYMDPETGEQVVYVINILVIPMPEGIAQGSGTAHFTVTQPVPGTTTLWETTTDIPY